MKHSQVTISPISGSATARLESEIFEIQVDSLMPSEYARGIASLLRVTKTTPDLIRGCFSLHED
jgi:hypothetical protein